MEERLNHVGDQWSERRRTAQLEKEAGSSTDDEATFEPEICEKSRSLAATQATPCQHSHTPCSTSPPGHSSNTSLHQHHPVATAPKHDPCSSTRVRYQPPGAPQPEFMSRLDIWTRERDSRLRAASAEEKRATDEKASAVMVSRGSQQLLQKMDRRGSVGDETAKRQLDSHHRYK